MLDTRVEAEQAYAAGMMHGMRFTHHLTMHKGQNRNDHSNRRRHTQKTDDVQYKLYNRVQQHVHYRGLLISSK